MSGIEVIVLAIFIITGMYLAFYTGFKLGKGDPVIEQKMDIVNPLDDAKAVLSETEYFEAYVGE